MDDQKIVKSDDDWRAELDPELYRIAREKGTEPAFTGKYYKINESGMYACAVCGNELFSSAAKFDSDSGWPSFDKPIAEGNIKLSVDTSQGTERTEVLCGKCGSHLGHVFDDGPKTTTGKRFCINSISLNLKKDAIT